MATLAVRNNNPGDLRYIGQPGATPGAGGFAAFPDQATGTAALENDLQAKVTGNTKTGLKPTSTLAQFAATYAPASDGNDPASYAANLAKQLGVTTDTPLAALQGRIHDFASAVAHNEDSGSSLGKAPISDYASQQISPLTHSQLISNINAMEQQGAKPQEIQSYLDSLKGSQQSAPQGVTSQPSSGVTADTLSGSGSGNGVTADTLSGSSGNPFQQYSGAQPASSGDGSDPSGGFLSGLQEDLSGTNPNSIGTQLANTAKGVGNFLFPAVGDAYHDFKGDNTKTGLQQAGDLGLSILPFIPGLGELGEGARGLGAATEGAGAIADAAKGGGLLSKIAANPVTRNAAVGYGAGTASNLSQGQSIPQAFMPNANNVGGAVLGGVAPVALKGLGSLAESVAGIDPQIKTKLASLGMEGNSENTNLYNQYMDAAKAHATNGESVAPENMAANNIDEASSKIDQMANQAGQEVGAANKAAANVPVTPDKIPPLANALNEGLDSFGYKVGTKPDGTLDLVQTRVGGVPLSAPEKARVLDIAERLNDFAVHDNGKGTGNVRMLDDLMTVLDKKHDYGMTGQDPLTGLFGKMRHAVNEVARTASPEFGAANDKLSQLKELQDTVKQIAGNRLQRGELLMRRMFGNNPADSQELFQKIRQATGVDLYKHAVLARHAIESVGSKADKSALQQMIEGSVKGHGGLLGAAANIATGAAKKTFANPEKIGRKIISGKSNGLLNDLVTKAAIRGGASL